MISIVILTVKEGKLIKIKIPAEHEIEVLTHYGKDWHKIKNIKRSCGVSYIEILQFNKFIIKRVESLLELA